jgi:hypothetical protein
MTISTFRLRGTLVAFGVLLACMLPASPAGAHGVDPYLVPVLHAVDPNPPGVVVQVRTTAGEQMLASNTESMPLEVLDPAGTPFLRLSRDGTSGNVTDPFFHRTLNPPDVPVRLPADAVTGAAPRWTRVDPQGNWGWFEPRLHPVPPGVDWRVDMRFGSQPVVVTGALEHPATTGSFLAQPARRSDGVQVDIAQGRPPAMLLVAPDRRVVVSGTGGVPFLRLDADGVFANPPAAEFGQNPDWVARPVGPDGWVRVGAPGRVTWLDARLGYPDRQPPAVVERMHRTMELTHWQIPMTVDGHPTALRGTLSWVPAGTPLPSRSAASGTPRLPLVCGGAVLAGAFLLVRRSRRAQVAPSTPSTA